MLFKLFQLITIMI